MIVAYLEKTRDRFLKERAEIQEKIDESLFNEKEYIEFIKLLEVNQNSNLEDFTPRSVNHFYKERIEELKEKQKEVVLKISQLEVQLKNIDNEIDEIHIVIEEAKRRLERKGFY